MFRILVDVNVPEEYVSALRGDGHDVVYSRDVDVLGPKASDDAIVSYAEEEGLRFSRRTSRTSRAKRRQYRFSLRRRT